MELLSLRKLLMNQKKKIKIEFYPFNLDTHQEFFLQKANTTLGFQNLKSCFFKLFKQLN